MEKERPGESKESIFRKWVGFAAGQWWPDKKAMGPAIDDALGKYMHYGVTPGNDPEEAARKAREGEEEFLRLTGYSAEEFVDFLYSLPPPPEEETK